MTGCELPARCSFTTPPQPSPCRPACCTKCAHRTPPLAITRPMSPGSTCGSPSEQRPLSRILRALHNPPIRELRSAASVKESKAPPPPSPLLMPPPVETTRLTAEPLATLVPAGGLSLITLPEATVLLDCGVTVPMVRPAPVMALVAVACIWPTTLGTDTVGPGEEPSCTSAWVAPLTTRE